MNPNNPILPITQDQFIEKWRTMLAGLALYGQYHQTEQVSLATRTEHAMSIPKKVEEMLRRMYRDLSPPAPAEPPKPEPTTRVSMHPAAAAAHATANGALKR